MIVMISIKNKEINQRKKEGRKQKRDKKCNHQSRHRWFYGATGHTSDKCTYPKRDNKWEVTFQNMMGVILTVISRVFEMKEKKVAL